MLFSLIMKYQTEIKNLNGANNSRRFMFLLKKYNKYSFFESKSGNSNKPLYLSQISNTNSTNLIFYDNPKTTNNLQILRRRIFSHPLEYF